VRATWTRRRLLDELGAPSDDAALARALPRSMASAITFPSIVMADPRRTTNVWTAPDGYVSHLHFDLGENLLTVVGGEKELLVFPPSQTRRLYPHSALEGAISPQNSQVDLDHLDGARFPRVKDARYWRVTLRRDETLYLPSRVWHFVRSRGESVAVNVWFERSERTLLERARAVPLAVRAYGLVARAKRG
jgi:hypothetical protein